MHYLSNVILDECKLVSMDGLILCNLHAPAALTTKPLLLNLLPVSFITAVSSLAALSRVASR